MYLRTARFVGHSTQFCVYPSLDVQHSEVILCLICMLSLPLPQSPAHRLSPNLDPKVDRKRIKQLQHSWITMNAVPMIFAVSHLLVNRVMQWCSYNCGLQFLLLSSLQILQCFEISFERQSSSCCLAGPIRISRQKSRNHDISRADGLLNSRFCPRLLRSRWFKLQSPPFVARSFTNRLLFDILQEIPFNYCVVKCKTEHDHEAISSFYCLLINKVQKTAYSSSLCCLQSQ